MSTDEGPVEAEPAVVVLRAPVVAPPVVDSDSLVTSAGGDEHPPSANATSMSRRDGEEPSGMPSDL
ncbi:MAG: hypothetical protein K0V04_22860, partial [Deltaproteobacteria bacterium]|nr:hypothetical protein [Deltaproteobacteria bacterium]